MGSIVTLHDVDMSSEYSEILYCSDTDDPFTVFYEESSVSKHLHLLAKFGDWNTSKTVKCQLKCEVVTCGFLFLHYTLGWTQKGNQILIWITSQLPIKYWIQQVFWLPRKAYCSQGLVRFMLTLYCTVLVEKERGAHKESTPGTYHRALSKKFIVLTMGRCIEWWRVTEVLVECLLFRGLLHSPCPWT